MQLREAIPLDDLRLTPASAPTTGFLPDTAPDFPVSADAVFAAQLQNVISAVNDNQVFLSRLEPGTSRNDDVRAAFLNNLLSNQVAGLAPGSMTRRAAVVHRAQLHELLSVDAPQLVIADIDAALEALRNAGLLANITTAGPSTIFESDLPTFSSQQAFFTLGGLMSASKIRMTLVKEIYVPILKDIVRNMQNLAIEGITRSVTDVTDIAALVTGASLSFHTFSLGNSIIEAQTTSTHKDGLIVLAIGPTLLGDLSDALSGVQGVQFTTLRDTVESIQQIKNAAEEANEAVQNGYAEFNADSVLDGCVFDNSATCRQLGFSAGIPVVHTSGSFPGPVLLIVYDAVSGQISLGNFLFFPN